MRLSLTFFWLKKTTRLEVGVGRGQQGMKKLAIISAKGVKSAAADNRERKKCSFAKKQRIDVNIKVVSIRLWKPIEERRSLGGGGGSVKKNGR